jgi:hypothetical protein
MVRLTIDPPLTGAHLAKPLTPAGIAIASHITYREISLWLPSQSSSSYYWFRHHAEYCSEFSAAFLRPSGSSRQLRAALPQADDGDSDSQDLTPL